MATVAPIIHIFGIKRTLKTIFIVTMINDAQKFNFGFPRAAGSSDKTLLLATRVIPMRKMRNGSIATRKASPYRKRTTWKMTNHVIIASAIVTNNPQRTVKSVSSRLYVTLPVLAVERCLYPVIKTIVFPLNLKP